MNEDLLFGLKLTLVGNIVVFSALTLIYWIMTGFKAVEERIQKSAKHKKEVKEPAETPASAEPTAEPQLQPELVAAISAAIAVVVDKKFQIKRIRYRTAPPEAAWSKHGIASIMGSHSTKRTYNR